MADKVRNLVIMLMGLCFAWSGSLSVILALYMIGCHIKTLFWTEVSATILEIGLYEKRSSVVIGNSSPPLLRGVSAKYTYIYDGEEYTGTKVFFFDSAGNSPFYHRIYRTLEKYKESGRPFRCFVNPSDPAEAVLYRDSGYDTVLVLSILGLFNSAFGGGIVIFFIRRYRKAERKSRFRYRPLMISPEEEKRGMFGHIVAGISWVLIYAFFVLPTLKSWFVIMLCGFPLFSLMITALYIAVHRFLCRRRHGDSVFEMTSGVIGGGLAGTIHTISNDISPGSEIRMTLSCFNRRCFSKKRTDWHTIWKCTSAISPKCHGAGRKVSVFFSVPDGLPDSDAGNPKDQICWELKAESGLNYKVIFRVPMFRT